MEVKEVEDSIGYCGLICKLCHEVERCGGCKSESNSCGRHLSEGGCFHYNCCIEKGLNGCWECEEAPCKNDMFSEQHDIRIRTFVKVAKAEGIGKLAEYVCNNQNNGIIYGWKKDYDNLEREEAVIDLLHRGSPLNHGVRKGCVD